jgi:integrase
MSGNLTARRVATAKVGKYGDGNNLYLIVSDSGSRKWILRFTWRGRPKEMGLGSATSVSLAEAREKAVDAKRKIAQCLNPIDDRRRDAGIPTFGAMADSVLESLSAGFRNAKHRAQWKMTLEIYAASLRKIPVDEVTTDDVLAVLKPIWLNKAETASRLRGRIEKVLDAAKARGLRQGENPAQWRGHLDHLLSKPSKLARGHHPAMPYDRVSQFIGQLRLREATAGLALEFCILTAARSGEVLGLTWQEINLKERIWSVPGERMKAGRLHRVPLSDGALEVLEHFHHEDCRPTDFVFLGQKPGRPLSNMAMEMMLRRMKVPEATVHGFRSSFRDWAGNETNFPRELAEAALAHVVGDKSEQAYRRSDALEKRRELMQAWSTWCKPGRENVVSLSKVRKRN